MAIVQEPRGRSHVIRVFQTNPDRQPKLYHQNHFLGLLVSDFNGLMVMDEMVKAVEEGFLTQEDLDMIIERALNIITMNESARLLAGKTSNVAYNTSTGEAEPKPHFGWGQ